MTKDNALLYRNYRNSAIRCSSRIKTAVDNGAVLSRREMFDYAFKTESSYKEKYYPAIRGMSRKDRTIASFFVLYFGKLRCWVDDGYSFADIRSFARDVTMTAWLRRLTKKLYSVSCLDANSVMTVTLFRGLTKVCTYTIENLDDLIDMTVSLVAFLGTEGLGADPERNFFEEYFFTECGNYLSNVPSRVYVDESYHDLFSILDISRGRESEIVETDSSSGKKAKILKYKAG